MAPRVPIPGLLAGIRPRPGTREINTFDLGLYGGPTDMSLTDARPALKGYRQPLPVAPKALSRALQENSLHKVLPCKEDPFSRRIGKPIHGRKNDGMYPQTGYARGQRKGLAADPNKPMNGPIMPIASSFYAALPNTLGQPKG